MELRQFSRQKKYRQSIYYISFCINQSLMNCRKRGCAVWQQRNDSLLTVSVSNFPFPNFKAARDRLRSAAMHYAKTTAFAGIREGSGFLSKVQTIETTAILLHVIWLWERSHSLIILCPIPTTIPPPPLPLGNTVTYEWMTVSSLYSPRILQYILLILFKVF